MSEAPSLLSSAPKAAGGEAHENRLPAQARKAARWLPALSVTVLAVGVVLHFGVSVKDVAIFAAYVGLLIALPGVLVLRAVYSGSRTLAEEIALGVALGYTIEIFAYIGARAAGMPRLVVIWPITTYVLFLAVPRLRRHWNSRRSRTTAPLWYSWSLALAFAYPVVWGAVSYLRQTVLTWPGLANSEADVFYHLALIGELKHHMPPTVPMVAGESLFYHWFVYAHLAATSWVTGLEPLVLLARLAVLPMLAAFVILIGMTARRVLGLWAGASLAVAAAMLAAIPNLYLGSNLSFSGKGIPDLAWTSPTQAFGALLFAAAVLVLIDIRRHRGNAAARESLLLGVLLLGVMGAKATYLPMLIVGLLGIASVEIVRRRRLTRPTITTLTLAAGCFLYAQFVLFGGVRQAMVVTPLYFIGTTWRELTGSSGSGGPSPGLFVALAMVWVPVWLLSWSGVLGLLTRPRSLLRAPVTLVLGIGAAGLGGALLLGQSGGSQFFFLCGACPYLAIVAAYGIIAVARRARLTRPAVIAALCAGLAAAYVIPVLCRVRVPLAPGQPDDLLIRPYVVLLVVMVLVTAALIAVWGRLRAAAMTIVVFSAVGLLADAHAYVLASPHLLGGIGPAGPNPAAQPVAVPQGAMDAGRWLRAHSSPDDLVATNEHCLPGQGDRCDSRHFWVSGLSERRMLVEGWAFTSTNQDRWRPGRQFVEYFPFWDGSRLEANDAAFSAPSAASMRFLAERYGVRWLFADERLTGPGSRIGEFATPRFHSGDYTVYELRTAPDHGRDGETGPDGARVS
ncbi:hypothetical protein ACFY05_15770 [Microtetraspora fusca]|uniref:Glycosyltransferase RgtA/B/C/D-like domain-containing protein n=1 Tax=Microtetraspora fusca TaxID=1997 RepID=A0ABW6V588_MICFU